MFCLCSKLYFMWFAVLFCNVQNVISCDVLFYVHSVISCDVSFYVQNVISCDVLFYVMFKNVILCYLSII